MTLTHPVDSPSPHGGLLALLAFGMLIVGVDAYIVVVALPEIGRELDFTAQSLQLVISGYAVAFGGFLLLGGRASDLLGRRRMFVLGLGLYAVASLAGGLAPSSELLVAARAVQGLGGALLFPSTLALISVHFEEGPARNRALSVWAGAGAAGLVVGSLLGGVLTDALGWEAVFLVNVPLAALGLVLAFRLIPADAERERGRRLDVPGAITGTAGTTLLVLALVQGPERGWGAPPIVVALAAAVLLLAAFLALERRSPDPLMPLRLFANRNLSAGTAITFMALATLGAILYFLTLYFQDVHGYDALETGLAFVLPTLIIVVGSGLGGRLVTRFGLRATLAGSLSLAAAGAVTVGLTMSPDASYAALIPGLVLLSLGDGITYTAMFIAATTGVPERDEGVASGIASTGMQVGGAIGLAVLVAIANAGTEGLTGDALRTATADGLATGAVLAAAGMAATVPIVLALRPERPDGAAGALAPAAAPGGR